MDFKLQAEFSPTGDQPMAIKELVQGLHAGDPAQTLLGVTGSGKTFTIANVIQETQRPTLILSHNKTLAAQLYGEFKQFFPENAVEYFVSYYDYYQPEAYLPTTDLYIEKDLSINDEIEKLRLSATSSLLSGRRDVIVVSSVSCIYGISNPSDFKANVTHIKNGLAISRNKLLHKFVTALYSRATSEFSRGTFRVKGDTIDIYPAYADIAYRISFWGDEIEDIRSFDPSSGQSIEHFEELDIYPANIFVTTQDRMQKAIWEIQQDMVKQVEFFQESGRPLEAKRLEERTTHDLEMMRELGYCSGIENYSRYFDNRAAGTRPFCLMDYFPEDYLLVVDESHVTVSQINAMYGGDRSRKVNLVDFGFRIPAAMDNRPLKFEEWEALRNQTIYVSATPADYELRASEGVLVEQLIRPTGVLDPIIEVRPTQNQIDDLMEEIAVRIEQKERVLITTLTKRMAEEMSKYLLKHDVNTRYIHSDIETLERIEILNDLRSGEIDVLVGVNLLREGLDLPEVSLVAVMDADKEGFLRSGRSLTQTAGRAARNVNGRVIFYADKITGSMQKTMDETNRRREKQLAYNEKYGITPKALKKKQSNMLQAHKIHREDPRKAYAAKDSDYSIAADPVIQYMSKAQLQKAINKSKKEMEGAAKDMNFSEAARLRDEMFDLQKWLEKKQ
ncbi:MAG: excinuclease ABC subunit B [Verrucomicrobia bacterium]|nr:excinuclease ABC subunit B [Verrucomicrobiota bacterium]